MPVTWNPQLEQGFLRPGLYLKGPVVPISILQNKEQNKNNLKKLKKSTFEILNSSVIVFYCFVAFYKILLTCFQHFSKTKQHTNKYNKKNDVATVGPDNMVTVCETKREWPPQAKKRASRSKSSQVYKNHVLFRLKLRIRFFIVF